MGTGYHQALSKEHDVSAFRPALILALALVLTWLPSRSGAQELHKVADSLYAIVGQGGNIGVSVGEDGVFMIDDQFAPLTEKIRGLISEVTDQPIRFLVNTHFHGDHTGGNENLGRAGVLIFAHDNVRQRLLQSGAPKEALPVVTFNDTTTFHMNGQTVHVLHVDRAHTDGDSMIHFREADVIHMGDVYFNGFYPFIDLRAGGSLQGTIAAVEVALGFAGENTRIIPGHGPISSRPELVAYHEMLVRARDGIQQLVEDGRTLEQVIAARPTADLDPEWADGFIRPAQFVRMVYTSLTR